MGARMTTCFDVCTHLCCFRMLAAHTAFELEETFSVPVPRSFQLRTSPGLRIFACVHRQLPCTDKPLKGIHIYDIQYSFLHCETAHSALSWADFIVAVLNVYVFQGY